MATSRKPIVRWLLTASALAAIAFAAMLVGAASSGAVNNPTGYWTLSLKLELTSTGTATNPRCYPNPEQVAPTPVSGTATQKVVWKTVRPTKVEFHEAPNGVPVAGETNYTRGFRGKLTETRSGNVELGGEPQGCYGELPKTDCGSRSSFGGIYVNPLGGIHSWKGFRVEPEQTPQEKYSRCGLTSAQFKLNPLDIDIVAKPSKLTSKAPKLVFAKTVQLQASDTNEGIKSTATGTLKYTITLVRASAYS